MDLKASRFLPLEKCRFWKVSFGMFQLQSYWMGEENQRNIVSSHDGISGPGFVVSFRRCPVGWSARGKELDSSWKLFYVPGKAGVYCHTLSCSPASKLVKGKGVFPGERRHYSPPSAFLVFGKQRVYITIFVFSGPRAPPFIHLHWALKDPAKNGQISVLRCLPPTAAPWVRKGRKLCLFHSLSGSFGDRQVLSSIIVQGWRPRDAVTGEPATSSVLVGSGESEQRGADQQGVGGSCTQLLPLPTESSWQEGQPGETGHLLSQSQSQKKAPNTKKGILCELGSCPYSSLLETPPWVSLDRHSGDGLRAMHRQPSHLMLLPDFSSDFSGHCDVDKTFMFAFSPDTDVRWVYRPSRNLCRVCCIYPEGSPDSLWFLSSLETPPST